MTNTTYGMRNAVLLALVVGLGAGCSLVVDFDRNMVTDGGAGDAGPGDGGGMDAGFDAGSDAGPACGNGAEDTGEACDDGNMSADDGCSDTCTIETGFECTGFGADTCTAICGDGMMLGAETCDDGALTACGTCNADCTAAGTGGTCGDGAICADPGMDEVCDDSNTDADDGCSVDCTMIETGWVCMDEPSVCAETCGDGMIDMGETCDDGNNDNDDGCSAACQAERGYMCVGEASVCSTVCGDGIIAGVEVCDDGNDVDDDGCEMGCGAETTGWECVTTEMADPESVCTAICGDGMMLGAEACDDGNTMTEAACPYGMATCDGFGCADDCTAVPTGLTGNICGDSNVDAVNETCDDGMGTPADDDGCSAACQTETGYLCDTPGSLCTEICGDGLVVGVEECDDTGTTAGDGCSGTCTEEAGFSCDGADPTVCDAICGDGMIVMGEACDDGNADACGLCSRRCTAARVLTAASGSFTVATDGSTTADAASITLNDGVNPAVTFELDSGAPPCMETATNRCVAFDGSTAAAIIADRLVQAINSMSIALEIFAELSGVDVTLSNTAGNGADGDQPIGSASIPSGWMLTGMIDGVAHDCGTGTGCTMDNDCSSGSCTSGTCD